MTLTLEMTVSVEADDTLFCVTAMLAVDVLEEDKADRASETRERSESERCRLRLPPEAASSSASVSVTSLSMHAVVFFSDMVPSSPFYAGL